MHNLNRRNFIGTAVESALGDVARFPGQGGVGEHRILGGEPAALNLLLLHPARDAFLDGHAADDARVAPLDERRAGGVGRDAVLEAQRAQLVGRAAVGAQRGHSGLRF